MCTQAAEEYELLEEKELREILFVNQVYFWHVVNKSRKVRQTINGIKNKNGKILCDTNTILHYYSESDRYGNDFKLFVENILNNIDNRTIYQ